MEFGRKRGLSRQRRERIWKGTFEEREEEELVDRPVGLEIELAVDWIMRNSSRCGTCV